MNIIDGIAYEAVMFQGCRDVPVDEAMRGVAMYQDMYVPVPDIQAGIAFGQGQRGKGYDYAGAAGIPLLASDDWSDCDRWWCSEHNFMQIGAAGLWLLDPAEQKRVTPDDLRQCNFPKSEIFRFR